MNTQQIKTAIRMKTQNENAGMPKSIIVKFNDKTLRDEIIKNKKNQEISSHTIIDTNEKRPVYISEQLTARRQFLFKMARDIKRNKLVEFAWTKDGDVIIRKNTNSKVIKVKYKEQLEQNE